MGNFSLVPEHIRQIQPYVPGKPVEEVERELGIVAVKMASNENPLGPSPLAMQAVREFLPQAHRYPIGDGYYLRQKLAGKLNVAMDNIILGSGSTDLIELAARTFLSPGEEVVTSDQSFLMYTLAAQGMNCRVIYAPLKNATYDLESILRAVTSRTKIIYLANPNNPTGTMFPATQMDWFLDKLPPGKLVVMDEAYYEYVQENGYSHSLDYLELDKPVLILRTFSKIYGMAGMRIGYGIGRPAIITCLNKVRSPFNTSSLGQAAAVAALDDSEHVQKSRQANQDGYVYLAKELTRLGIHFVPSVTNFILVDTQRDCLQDFQLLMQRGVIIRPMKGNGFPTAFRITIGKQEENEMFVQALQAIL